MEFEMRVRELNFFCPECGLRMKTTQKWVQFGMLPVCWVHKDFCSRSGKPLSRRVKGQVGESLADFVKRSVEVELNGQKAITTAPPQDQARRELYLRACRKNLEESAGYPELVKHWESNIMNTLSGAALPGDADMVIALCEDAAAKPSVVVPPAPAHTFQKIEGESLADATKRIIALAPGLTTK